MEKSRLLEVLKSEPNDVDAIGMILSNYTDYGHTELGGMVSVKKFKIVAEVLLEWWGSKQTINIERQLTEPAVSVVQEPIVVGAVCPRFQECLNGGKNQYCDFQTFKEIDCFKGQTER